MNITVSKAVASVGLCLAVVCLSYLIPQNDLCCSGLIILFGLGAIWGL
jgi:hypothetical protein